MALAVAKVTTNTSSHVAGNHVHVYTDITGDASYPTGGWSLTPAMLGLDSITFVLASVEGSGTYIAAYDYANQKLKAFSALGTQVTNATDLHTITWRVFVAGRGRPSLGVTFGT